MMLLWWQTLENNSIKIDRGQKLQTILLKSRVGFEKKGCVDQTFEFRKLKSIT